MVGVMVGVFRCNGRTCGGGSQKDEARPTAAIPLALHASFSGRGPNGSVAGSGGEPSEVSVALAIFALSLSLRARAMSPSVAWKPHSEAVWCLPFGTAAVSGEGCTVR